MKRALKKPTLKPWKTIDQRWRNCPYNKIESAESIKGRHCMACGSSWIDVVARGDEYTWTVVCRKCHTEMPIVVLLNRRAWRYEEPGEKVKI